MTTAISAAAQAIAARKQQRHGLSPEARVAEALENMADDMTMIRAELSVMRELVALMQAKMK